MKMKNYFFTLLFVSSLLLVRAAEVNIGFGASFGNAYSPASVTVNVGDSILWEGDFSSHPLASLTIPAGAASFSQSSGGSFWYVVTTPGTYNYKCTVHAGMTGSFVANAVSTNISNINNYSDFKIFPTTVQNNVYVDLGNTDNATIVITNLLGDKVLSVEVTDKATIDVSSYNSGLYFVNVYEADKIKATRRFYKN